MVMAFASPGAASTRIVDDPTSCVTVAATDRAGTAKATAAAAMHGTAIRLRRRPSISTTFPRAPAGLRFTFTEGKRIVLLGHLPADGASIHHPSVLTSHSQLI